MPVLNTGGCWPLADDCCCCCCCCCCCGGDCSASPRRTKATKSSAPTVARRREQGPQGRGQVAAADTGPAAGVATPRSEAAGAACGGGVVPPRPGGYASGRSALASALSASCTGCGTLAGVARACSACAAV